MAKLETIKKPESLARMAYEAIRKSILSGQWKTGELYNEKAIAADLGISRTPVREALLELASNDLILFLPRRGLMINNFNHQDVDEIFELRKAIELAAIEKVTNMSPLPDLLTIEESLLNQKRAMRDHDHTLFIEADRLFHTRFCMLNNNRRMIAIVENIRDMIHMMGIKALSLKGRFINVIEEHQAILDAVRDGNALKARNLMAYHLDQSMDAVKESEL